MRFAQISGLFGLLSEMLIGWEMLSFLLVLMLHDAGNDEKFTCTQRHVTFDAQVVMVSVGDNGTVTSSRRWEAYV